MIDLTPGFPSGNPRCERSLTPTARMRKTSANPTETLPLAEWPGSTKVVVVTIEGYHLRRRGLQWELARAVSGLIRFFAAVVDAVRNMGRNPHRVQRPIRLASRPFPGYGGSAPDARRALPRSSRSRPAFRRPDPADPGRRGDRFVQPGLLVVGGFGRG